MIDTISKVQREIYFKNIPVTLIGRKLKVNRYAPFFNVVDRDLKKVNLKNLKNKIKVITTFPSLNTSVCSIQVKKFNNELYSNYVDIDYIGISKDLPFAQKLFCDDNNISNITLLSDYKYSSFGINYGLLIKELNLLARSVMIIDKNNLLRYIQIAEETTDELDYEDILVNIEKIQKEKEINSIKDFPLNCSQDGSHLVVLSEDIIDKLLLKLTKWKLENNNKIMRYFSFPDSLSAKHFTEMVNIIAEEQNHHPEINHNYNKVKVTLTTHSSNGLTQNDFILAKIIDELE